MLEVAEIEGWPLPYSLLQHDGDLKRSYTPAERKRLVKSLAEISDVQTIDDTCRVLATKLRIPFSQLLADIDDCRAGTSENGFLGGEEELQGNEDLDQNWIVPYLLPRAETIVLSADPGVGKSLFCYSLAYASAIGDSFLGFPVPKGVPLILQLEEGGTFQRRFKAVGLAKSAGNEGLELQKDWFFSTKFDLAKPRQVEQLKLLIRNRVDLVIVDSARAVARSLSVDENHADFGKLVIRKIAKMINNCGKAGVIVHHNAGSGKASGTKDISAGVWGVFNLKQDESAPTLRTIQSDKLREGTGIFWQLSLDRVDGADGSSDGWDWKLVADKSYMAPDLNWRMRFMNLLLVQTQPISFRDAGELMNLTEAELHSMSNSVLRDRSLRRWADGPVRKGSTTRFFIPQEYRLHTSCKNNQEVQTRDSHPKYEIDKSVEVDKEDSQRLESSPTHNLHTVSECGSHFHTNTSNPNGVSLSSERKAEPSQSPHTAPTQNTCSKRDKGNQDSSPECVRRPTSASHHQQVASADRLTDPEPRPTSADPLIPETDAIPTPKQKSHRFNSDNWVESLQPHQRRALDFHLQFPAALPAQLINKVWKEDTPSSFDGCALKRFLESPDALAWIDDHKQSQSKQSCTQQQRYEEDQEAA